MNDDRSVHDIVTGSLDRHARPVGTPTGDLGDVLRRVDRRRARRRGTAVIGSTLAVAAGAAGIVLTAGPGGTPAPGDGDPDATTEAAGSWGCIGLLASDGVADYYVSCEPFPGVVHPSVPLVAPATSVSDGPVRSYPTVAPVLPTNPPMVLDPTTTTTTLRFGDATYIVETGDSVYSIADRFGVLPGDLAAFNGWAEGINHPLQVGDTIAVPSPFVTMPPVPTTGPSATTVPAAVLPTTTTTTLPGEAFRCTGPLGADLSYAYYLSCETVPWADVPPDLVVPTTVPVLTAPPTLPPATTGPPVAGQLDCGAPTTVVGEAAEREQRYTAVSGDSLTRIAELHGISLCVLVNYNAWPDGVEHPLFVGDIVKIPPGSRIP